ETPVPVLRVAVPVLGISVLVISIEVLVLGIPVLVIRTAAAGGGRFAGAAANLLWAAADFMQ
ncbi:hypothetical protein, partial [Actinobaculum suis]|uniref:hypothetical protein n=1 Tax=Actinobaculum suis TaxID=1657 RepID=UPI001E53802D